jgi:hypothetical protein
VIGNGMYFSGDSSTSYAYISAPANVPGLSLGGMDSLTISMWVNIPSYTLTGSNKTKGALDLYDTTSSTSPECYTLGTEYGNLASQKGLYYGFQGSPIPGTDNVNPGNVNFWNRGAPTGWVANQWEQITMVYSAGTEGYVYNHLTYDTGIGFLQYYVNGLLVSAVEAGTTTFNTLLPVNPAPTGTKIAIGCYYPNYLSGYTQMWYGGLNDIGIWNTDLTASYSVEDQWVGLSAPSQGAAAGGEVGALYNVPMYNGHAGPLSQYGVSALDKLFTIYDSASSTPIGVVTSNGTLGWKYVASGLSGTSGDAGQFSDGQYYIQLDSNGGGVETLLPGDANGDGKVDINDLTIVLASYGKTGQGWANGDFIGDGTVDINDLTIVLASYNQSYVGAPGGPATVPEPSALLLLSAAVAAGMLACARRRRGS